MIKEADRSEQNPYYFICIMKDMIDKINMEIDVCNSTWTKAEYRFIKMRIEQLTKDYDHVFIDDYNKEDLK